MNLQIARGRFCFTNQSVHLRLKESVVTEG
jgi:hypothetical protein